MTPFVFTKGSHLDFFRTPTHVNIPEGFLDRFFALLRGLPEIIALNSIGVRTFIAFSILLSRLFTKLSTSIGEYFHGGIPHCYALRCEKSSYASRRYDHEQEEFYLISRKHA